MALDNIISNFQKSDQIVRSHLRLILAVVLCVLFFSSASFRVFHSRGEPREALIVQDMLSNQDYVLAKGYSGTVPSKPPLFHWISLAFSEIAGQVTELTSRLPSVVSAILVGILIFNFFSKYTDKYQAFNTVILLSTSFEWLRAGATARVDMLLSAALVAAFIASFDWDRKAYKGYPYLLVVALTAAVLTKGPIGIVLPGFVFVVYSLISKESFTKIITRSLIVFGPALMAAGLWYLAAYLIRPDEFLDKVYYENVARFLSSQEDEPHKASAFKLSLTVISGFMPWSLILIPLAVTQRKSVINFIRNIRHKLQSMDRLNLFSFVVIVCTLFFYSIPESKRSVYLLPLYPFMAYLMAKLFFMPFTDSWQHYLLKMLKAAFYLMLSMPLILFTAAYFKFNPLIDEITFSVNSFYMQNLFAVIALLATWMLVVILRKKSMQANNLPVFYQIFAVLFCLNVFAQVFIVPAVMNPISAQKFAQQAEAEFSKAKRILSFGEAFYAISFYSNKTFYRAVEVTPVAGDLLLVNQDDFEEFSKSGHPFETLMVSDKSVLTYGKKVILLKLI